ncbi:MAG: site-specific integrase [Ilumatobacteraceae bacterium]
MAGRALKHYSKWSSEEYDEVDEYAKLLLPKQPPATKNTVATLEDVEKLLAVCTRSSDEIENFLALRDAALVHVFACTGCRLGEVSRMNVSDLDTTTKTITLPKTKNGDVRRTQLTADAMRAIRRYQRVAPPISELVLFVTWTNRRMSADAIRKAITRRCKAAGVNITPHSFRRGFAMLWLRRGGSETHLMTIAGWKTHSMVGRYVKAVAGEEALLEQARIFDN